MPAFLKPDHRMWARRRSASLRALQGAAGNAGNAGNAGLMNRATSTVRTSVPLVPVIVTVAGPTVAVLETVRVSSVSGPDVAGGLNAAVTPSGSPLAVKLTTSAKPLLGTIGDCGGRGVALDQAQPRWAGRQEEVLRCRRVDEQGDVDGANQRAAGSDDGHGGGAHGGIARHRQGEQRVRSGGDQRVNVAVTPLGSPLVAKLTGPVKPSMGMIETVLLAVSP